MASIPPPSTPVLLYLGAGYDLSPLLTFSPNPPYHITTRSTTYTSFLFVDAKPRKTSAFMVPDFDQWIDVPARVRNVMRYAQGMLDRWRLIQTSKQHEDTDIIWFEGGGSPVQIESRHADPEWHFVSAPPRLSHDQSKHDRHAPLTTLFYVFNTLDVELVRMSALARVWPCVTALYVHGLRPHPVTGLDRLIGGEVDQGAEHFAGDGLPSASRTPVHTRGLQHVYALVGSWGTPRHGRACGVGAQRGVRHVDFVRAGLRAWRESVKQGMHEKDGSVAPRVPLAISHNGRPTKVDAANSPETLHLYVSESESDSDSGMGNSPLVFRRAYSLDSDTEEWGASESGDEGWAESSASPNPILGVTTSLDSSWQTSRSFISPRFSTVHITKAYTQRLFHETLPIQEPFHTRIPQIAWDDALNGGLGGYYIFKTVEESLAVWRSRSEGLLETEGEESTDEEDMEIAEIPGNTFSGKAMERTLQTVHSPCPSLGAGTDPSHLRSIPPRLRLRPRAPQISHRTPGRAGHVPSPSLASTSDTDVSEVAVRPTRSRWLFRRRGRVLSGGPFPLSSAGSPRTPKTARLREHRIDLCDFLRSPAPTSYLSHAQKAQSCPELKDTIGPAGSSQRRLFSPLWIHHVLSALGIRGGRASTAVRSSTPRASPHPPPVLSCSGKVSMFPPTPPPSTPPSPPTKSLRSRHVILHHKSKSKSTDLSGPPSRRKSSRASRVVEQENDLFSWLGVCKPTGDRAGMDSCESDMTRVQD